VWISPLLAVVSALWCVAIGYQIWHMRIGYSVIGAVPGRPHETTFEYKSFPEASPLGPLPLIVPALLAMVAACAAFRRARLLLAVLTVLLAAFCVITGFSIGSEYLRPAAVLMVSALFALAARDETVEERSA
jgi:hypothetical protein